MHIREQNTPHPNPFGLPCLLDKVNFSHFHGKLNLHWFYDKIGLMIFHAPSYNIDSFERLIGMDWANLVLGIVFAIPVSFVKHDPSSRFRLV
ncbi:unnamed protein product [Sphenostylis stenocarpa]|uniref:Uncharacterized protein n=1 Tax=Sphenostylis stenocarpa TaxID=92480 RepID=A0AA86SCU4_9FABA|nr:unnamed protein product [Sphenostylis stenocarpa]